jgi:acetyltransferase
LGRLSRERIRGGTDAEFSLLVADQWQGRGVGSRLLEHLIEVARREGITRIYADVSEANLRMRRLCARLGFALGAAQGGIVRAERKV